MSIILVAALARNRVIGKDGKLPWSRIPGDLPRFKAMTLGHTVIMGRKTFDSIGKALPGRTNVVVTRDAGFRADGVEVAASIDAALARPGELFVIGGGELYAATLARADQLELTRVNADFDGDVRFPDFDEAAWRVIADEAHGPVAEFPHVWRYQALTRR